ncbi:MAG: hypothetical protein K8H84_03420 [Sulfuricella denitrificans]|nr:hypothetical protein [Sulfuricella denitrificans]
MGILQTVREKVRGLFPAAQATGTTEVGYRPTPEDQVKYLYRQLWVDPDLRQAILDIREMDRADGRVRRIHARVARDTIKGGLVFTQPQGNDKLKTEWNEFRRRLQLNRVEKLKSHARGLVMEGNLPLQIVVGEGMKVMDIVRMPSETILPKVSTNGRFTDVRQAYAQFDVLTGAQTAQFALWQMIHVRFDPDNFDDMGSLGRPFLDASRETWKKLRMTEQDLVIRRRMRAPLRMAHVLEGATDDQINTYRANVEKDQAEGVTTDYYLNKKGGITAVQGDAALGEIGDVVHLLDTFFAGSPLPKGLMGYTDGMARDILEDLKRDYYEEVDLLQETLSWGYEQAFRLQLLLKGINPDDEDFTVTFAERRTETPNQTTDRMLKWKAMGVPRGMVWEELGFNADDVEARRDWESKNYDPYPDAGKIGMGSIIAPGGKSAPNVSVTPGNAPKGESATSIGNGG